MRLIDTHFGCVKVFEVDIFKDNRGYFFESFKASNFAKFGITTNFVQDNISHSVKNTIRGLHLQLPPFGQAKLCQVLSGVVKDVFVDLRKDSPTWGEYAEVELSETNRRMLYLPEGFAHGFEVLSERALFHYKCSREYTPESERILSVFDNNLKIKWRSANPIISSKDGKGLSLDGVKEII